MPACVCPTQVPYLSEAALMYSLAYAGVCSAVQLSGSQMVLLVFLA